MIEALLLAIIFVHTVVIYFLIKRIRSLEETVDIQNDALAEQVRFNQNVVGHLKGRIQ